MIKGRWGTLTAVTFKIAHEEISGIEIITGWKIVPIRGTAVTG